MAPVGPDWKLSILPSIGSAYCDSWLVSTMKLWSRHMRCRGRYAPSFGFDSCLTGAACFDERKDGCHLIHRIWICSQWKVEDFWTLASRRPFCHSCWLRKQLLADLVGSGLWCSGRSCCHILDEVWFLTSKCFRLHRPRTSVFGGCVPLVCQFLVWVWQHFTLSLAAALLLGFSHLVRKSCQSSWFPNFPYFCNVWLWTVSIFHACSPQLLLPIAHRPRFCCLSSLQYICHSGVDVPSPPDSGCSCCRWTCYLSPGQDSMSTS